MNAPIRKIAASIAAGLASAAMGGCVGSFEPATDPSSPVARERAAFQKLYPFSKGEPDDIAPIAVFLASDESRMLTGTTIAADGGRSSYLKVYAGD